MGMLGGGNRGRGVGNEPSRSLRGSGLVARLLRSELSAEHLSLSRVDPRARARSVMECEDWHVSGAGLYAISWRPSLLGDALGEVLHRHHPDNGVSIHTGRC